MNWIWQHPEWPAFAVDRTRLRPLEARFLHGAGRRIGSWRHLDTREQTELRVQWLSTEALETSAIEGEILDRESLQSSIRRHFGLSGDRGAGSPAEAGVADMMVSLYGEFDRPLDHDMLWRRPRMLMGECHAAATGDLADLVAKGALRRSGERRNTRYWLNLPAFERLDEHDRDRVDESRQSSKGWG